MYLTYPLWSKLGQEIEAKLGIKDLYNFISRPYWLQNSRWSSFCDETTCHKIPRDGGSDLGVVSHFHTLAEFIVIYVLMTDIGLLILWKNVSNQIQNILKFLHGLAQFPYPTNAKKLDDIQRKLNALVASRISEQLKT